jgi:peptide/nickel transport system substrate-binding protein
MSLIDRRTKLKARRIFRKQKRKAEEVGEQADQNFNRLFFRRFDRLQAVRRFVAVWVVLVLMLGLGALWQVRALDKYYLESTPIAGGVYREGIIGTFTNSNPMFATSAVDTSVSKLIYSGLFKISPQGEVLGDLAASIDTDDRGSIYTVKLRDNIYWQDGEKFDSDDVIFTYKAIQNPATKSSLRSSWTGVKITAPDKSTVVFTLPNPFSSFPYALTNGIVPEHILGELDLEDLRSSKFNTVAPLGTGQFKQTALEVSGADKENRQERIALAKNDGYYGEKPGPNSVVIRSYVDEEKMIKDFEDKVIQSMVGLTSVSDNLKDQEFVDLQQSTLTSSVMVFMNNSNEILSDKKIRQALIHSTNVQDIRKSLGYDAVSADSPFLKSQFAYDPEIVQLSYDPVKAEALFDETGWVKGEDGMRNKDGSKLTLRLVSQSLSEYASIAQKLQEEWGKVGVHVEAVLQPEEEIQSSALIRHDYDVLLYGISIGYDPDVFAYWHSSQSDPNSSNLNLSEYSNGIADTALEAGRTRVDESLRKVKYAPFLTQWREDAPAIALYQPRFVMVTRGTFEGFNSEFMSSATDRYWSISEWKIRNDELVKQN